jgi:hypothetical protein
MIQALFYKSYYAYLIGDKENASLYYTLLKEEFKLSGKSDSLKYFQLTALKKIKEALTSNNIVSSNWLSEPVTISTEEQDRAIDLEKDVVKRIHLEGFNKLREILKSNDKFYLYNLEHPCLNYGKVDMIYMDTNIAYPIEVKRGIGKHDLIGQIMKYSLALKLRLHYSFYEEVKPVTICCGYKDYVVQELKKLGVMTLIYEISNNSLTLQAV